MTKIETRIAAAVALLEEHGYRVTKPAKRGRGDAFDDARRQQIVAAIKAADDGVKSKTAVYKHVAHQLGISYGAVFKHAGG